MFGLEYLLSAAMILVQLGMAIVWAIPVNLIWSKIGHIYFSFLPEIWLEIPYWHIVGLTFLCAFVGGIIKDLVPKIVNIDNSSKGEK